MTRISMTGEGNEKIQRSVAMHGVPSQCYIRAGHSTDSAALVCGSIRQECGGGDGYIAVYMLYIQCSSVTPCRSPPAAGTSRSGAPHRMPSPNILMMNAWTTLRFWMDHQIISSCAKKLENRTKQKQQIIFKQSKYSH